MNARTYSATQTPNERGRMVWIVTTPSGAALRFCSQYRGDAGRIRIFRTESAAKDFAAMKTNAGNAGQPKGA